MPTTLVNGQVADGSDINDADAAVSDLLRIMRLSDWRQDCEFDVVPQVQDVTEDARGTIRCSYRC